ncbi:MAG: hypothetical protein ACW9W4_08125 [Candidatus Nitrosopumilus sp. bin_7KS]
MGKFWQNNATNQENNREFKKQSTKLQQSLAELECEEAIIEDKKEFGRAKKSMMNVLRAKYSDDVTNRALSRVNERLPMNFFQRN